MVHDSCLQFPSMSLKTNTSKMCILFVWVALRFRSYVQNSIPEMNGEAGDGAASSVSPVVQSNPSHAVQSDASAVLQSILSAVEESNPVAAVPADPLTTNCSNCKWWNKATIPQTMNPGGSHGIG